MKVDFSKVESILSESLRKIFIERLSELAALATLIQDSKTSLPPKVIEGLVSHFQKELSQIKVKDSKLYAKLDLNAEDEQRFSQPVGQYGQEDWKRLKILKENIEALKRELQGSESPQPEHEKQVEKERRRHIYKRFNIREDWLPLH